MSPELIAAYEEAILPFVEPGSSIKPDDLRKKSWRYFVEINTACNLRCTMCTCGNKEGYEHSKGVMDHDLLEKVLDKIRNENNQCIVFLYGNSEPFLHPRLPECISAVKARGLRCEFSTNLNVLKRLEETLQAGPDFIIVSVSGFTQEVYGKAHVGGHIEKVKENMKTLSEAKQATGSPVTIMLNYHKYLDNQHEIEPMKEYAESLGFTFMTCWARAISMENAIQFCRSKDESATPYEVQNGNDWNAMLPPISDEFIENAKRLKVPPDLARGMYERFPVLKVCPVGDAFSYVRHDGKISLCACVHDRRMTLGNFLEMSQEELSEKRRGNAICQQCLKYRMNLYFHIADPNKWDEIEVCTKSTQPAEPADTEAMDPITSSPVPQIA